MFIGRYDLSIDPKGRLSIPAKYREELAAQECSELVLATFDGCIIAYTTHGWRKVVEELKSLPSNQAQVRQFKRRFFSSAQECRMDKQGRVLIPPGHRTDAGLGDGAVVLGLMDRFEIWARDRWESYIEEADERYQETAESLPSITGI